jgi:F-type H+-transporting ATP synthase subunit e
VFYGFYHQRSITAAEKKAAAQREYEHKQDLINKAKEAYAKSKQPAAQTTSASAGRELSFPRERMFRLNRPPCWGC